MTKNLRNAISWWFCVLGSMPWVVGRLVTCPIPKNGQTKVVAFDCSFPNQFDSELRNVRAARLPFQLSHLFVLSTAGYKHLPKWAPALVQLFRALSTYPHLPLSWNNNGAGWSSKTHPRTCQENFCYDVFVKCPQKTYRSGIFGFGVLHKQTHGWAATGTELL